MCIAFQVVNGDASLKQLAPDVDWVLISQGFDDHCHPGTSFIGKGDQLEAIAGVESPDPLYLPAGGTFGEAVRCFSQKIKGVPPPDLCGICGSAVLHVVATLEKAVKLLGPGVKVSA